MKNIVIVGGGSAGWMTACYLKNKIKDVSVTLVESPKIGIIGVGESVTVHLTKFLADLNIDEHHMMQETGSVYKFGNNFVGWHTGKDESELFPFRWNIKLEDIQKVLIASKAEPNDFISLKKLHRYNLNSYFRAQEVTSRFTDYWLELYRQKRINTNFGCSFGGYDYFSKYQKMPASNDEMLFHTSGLQHAYHINAELFGEYLKTHVGLKSGVVHHIAHVKHVVVIDNQIEKIVFDDDTEISADLYIDCTGFNRILVGHLEKDWKYYENNPADTAIVCQVNYDNPQNEVVNHTLSIAQDQGWVFDISLFHRKGTGYVFGKDLVDETLLIDEYNKNFLKNARMNPRKISWEKKRLRKAAEGNTVAIGLSNGFVEPMEANLFAIIINGILHLTDEIHRNKHDLKNTNWNHYNEKMSNTYDDIADFILVHYTLSSRPGKFWDEMRSIGEKLHHKELLIDKYKDARNTFLGAGQGHSIFVDYMWLQLAIGWNLSLDDWPKKTFSDTDLNLVEEYINTIETKTKACAENFPNNYEYLKDKIFHGRQASY